MQREDLQQDGDGVRGNTGQPESVDDGSAHELANRGWAQVLGIGDFTSAAVLQGGRNGEGRR
jgi:hypothetical protein